VPVAITKLSSVTKLVPAILPDAEMLMLVINEEFEVVPKKSLAEVVLKLFVLPFEKATVIIPGMRLNSASVTKIFAPSAVTPGLKVSVIGASAELVLIVILPPVVPVYNPPGADAVHVGEPVPKLPFKVSINPTGTFSNVSVAEIVYPAVTAAVVKADKL
jgi:hypothetical protein